MANMQHSISRRINMLRQALISDKNKVAFLLGAGCPLSIKNSDNSPLIPDIAGLTSTICSQLDTDKINILKQGITLPGGKSATIEDILSRVRLLIEAIGESTFEGLKKSELVTIEKEICVQITQIVEKDLPDDITSYHNLASWVSGIPREHPVEIFTPNYDLLIESSLEAKDIPFFDGFVGSMNAFFDLHSMEHEELPARWVRLWKLHGSINWWINSKGKVFRGVSKDKDKDKQMIYPSHLKYTQSRRMPYLAMQDRLSRFLSNGQSVLVTNGYSFADQHLNEIITQKLSANPRSVCFGLLFDNIEKYPEALECAQKTTNLHLLTKNASYFAGEQKKWETDEDSQYSYLTEKNENEILCKIGDFSLFSLFLLKQTGNMKMEEHGEN